MGAATAVEELQDAVRESGTVAPVGGRTHWEVGNPLAPGAGDDLHEVRAPDGIVAYEPADLTVTVRAGTRVGDLAAVLSEHGQECALDPRSAAATVGGVLATGLSGARRLKLGPLRDRVLEVRFVNAAGDVVKGGGPTVKNVSGFDIPRLLVGSFGTIGVLTQVTLRCQPLAAASGWGTTDADPFVALARGFRPSSVLWDGNITSVLVEGVAADVAAELQAMGAPAGAAGPAFPDGPHRGRVSARPTSLRTIGPALTATGVRWLAEIGVGTVHVACDTEAGLAAARSVAHDHGGWLLREAGAPGIDGFGVELPNRALQARIRVAFDPSGKFSPGRLPT
jgi:glycolate oxidase FAD binding subunit